MIKTFGTFKDSCDKNERRSERRSFCVHDPAFMFAFAFTSNERRSRSRSPINERVREGRSFERRSFERRSLMLW